MKNNDLAQGWRERILNIHTGLTDAIDQRPDGQELPALEIAALALELALDTLDGNLARANEVLKALTQALHPGHTLSA
jgi:hypothetical protein